MMLARLKSLLGFENLIWFACHNCEYLFQVKDSGIPESVKNREKEARCPRCHALEAYIAPPPRH